MIGLSFAPIGNPNEPERGQSGPVNPVQEAIKVLNLKIPRIGGQASPIPHALLAGLGSAGSSPLEQILAQLFGQGLSAPAPDFDLGDDPGNASNGLTFQPPEPPQTPSVQPPQQFPPRMPPRGQGPLMGPYSY